MADFLVDWTEAQQPEVMPDLKKWTMHFDAVSYTHLTLPTILLV